MEKAPFLLHGVALSGPTYKVALMLALSDQPFNYRHVDLPTGQHKSAAFLEINRFGQVPALSAGEVHLCQSNAILIHLAETLGRFDAEGAELRLKVREWLFWEADRLAPSVFRGRAIARGFLKVDPAVGAFYAEMAKSALGVLEAHCAEGWLVGSGPTIADIACYVVTTYAAEAGLDLGHYPHVRHWQTRVEALPHWQPALDLMHLPQVA